MLNCLHFQRFAAVIMHIRGHKMTALIFASIKMVVTGVKLEDDSHLASCKYACIHTVQHNHIDSQHMKFCEHL